jgi:hypothetical protein
MFSGRLSLRFPISNCDFSAFQWTNVVGLEITVFMISNLFEFIFNVIFGELKIIFQKSIKLHQFDKDKLHSTPKQK